MIKTLVHVGFEKIAIDQHTISHRRIAQVRPLYLCDRWLHILRNPLRDEFRLNLNQSPMQTCGQAILPKSIRYDHSRGKYHTWYNTAETTKAAA